MADSTPTLSISNSEENTKQQLSKFTKSEIIDEMHKIWTVKQISKLINNLSAAKTQDQPTSSKDPNWVPPPPTQPPARSRLDTLINMQSKKKEIVYKGWLSKRGKTLSNAYKKRYFVLYTNCTLMYFEKREDVNNKKADAKEIFLPEFTALNKTKSKNEKEYKFDLVSKGRTFFLKTEDAQSYNEWTKRLTERVSPSKLYKGWSMKTSLKNGKKGKWQKRYFVLVRYEYTNYELRYYEDSKCLKFRGMIDIGEVMDVKAVNGKKAIKEYGSSNNICLEIMHNLKTLVMSFKDSEVRDTWKDKIGFLVAKNMAARTGTPVYSPDSLMMGSLVEDKSVNDEPASGGWLDNMLNDDKKEEEVIKIKEPTKKKETKKERKEREKKEKKQKEKEEKMKKEEEKQRKKEEEKRKKEEKKKKKKEKGKQKEEKKTPKVETKKEPKVEVKEEAISIEEKPEPKVEEQKQVEEEEQVQEDEPEVEQEYGDEHENHNEHHHQYEEEEDDFALDIGGGGDYDDDNGDEYPDDREESLPYGWIACYTEDDNVYYHNEELGVTQWERPE